jgi:phosphonate transport system ATP-binding protein
LDYAREFCNRIIGMNCGRIVYDGPPERLSAATVAEIYEKERQDPLDNTILGLPYAPPALSAA